MRTKTIIIATLVLLAGQQPASAFKVQEHKQIGDRAFLIALKQSRVADLLDREPHIDRRKQTIGATVKGREFSRFTFGDLTAIYGDQIEGVEVLNSDRFTIGHYKTARERSDVLKHIVSKGYDAVLAKYPVERRQVINLALDNDTHFSGVALRTYVKQHRRALQLARQPGKLWLALHYEALALHSFTDLFAFGHMMEDRELTRKLTNATRQAENGSKLAGALSNLITKPASAIMAADVNYLHNALNFRGAQLTNLKGETWTGYGDGKYRASDRQQQIIVSATAASIGEVLRAAMDPRKPDPEQYRAVCRLPIRYDNAYWPRPIALQGPRLAMLGKRMHDMGRPLEKNGFDFSLGILAYENRSRRGSVSYISEVLAICGDQ
jgi:hypothetical protein